MTNIFKLISVVALALAVLGLLLPAQAPQAAPTAAGSQALTFGTSNFGGSIAVAGDATVVGAVSGGSLAGGSVLVGGIISGASLTVNGVAQSGAIKYGTQSGVISGTTIAHGIGTTPTVFLVNNDGRQATNFTQTLYHGACDVTSCTVYYSQGSITTTVIDWIAGK